MQSTRSRQARPVDAARKGGAVAEPTGVAAVIAGLQRSAGNRAVSALIARDEAKKQAPGSDAKTVVMPDPIGTLEVFSFQHPEKNEIDLLVKSSAADPALMKAAQNGDYFEQVTITYGPLTMQLLKVVVAQASLASDGAISVRFNAGAVHQKYGKDDEDQKGPPAAEMGWDLNP